MIGFPTGTYLCDSCCSFPRLSFLRCQWKKKTRLGSLHRARPSITTHIIRFNPIQGAKSWNNTISFSNYIFFRCILWEATGLEAPVLLYQNKRALYSIWRKIVMVFDLSYEHQAQASLRQFPSYTAGFTQFHCACSPLRSSAFASRESQSAKSRQPHPPEWLRGSAKPVWWHRGPWQ